MLQRGDRLCVKGHKGIAPQFFLAAGDDLAHLDDVGVAFNIVRRNNNRLAGVEHLGLELVAVGDQQGHILDNTQRHHEVQVGKGVDALAGPFHQLLGAALALLGIRIDKEGRIRTGSEIGIMAFQVHVPDPVLLLQRVTRCGTERSALSTMEEAIRTRAPSTQQPAFFISSRASSS